MIKITGYAIGSEVFHLQPRHFWRVKKMPSREALRTYLIARKYKLPRMNKRDAQFLPYPVYFTTNSVQHSIYTGEIVDARKASQ